MCFLFVFVNDSKFGGYWYKDQNSKFFQIRFNQRYWLNDKQNLVKKYGGKQNEPDKGWTNKKTKCFCCYLHKNVNLGVIAKI